MRVCELAKPTGKSCDDGYSKLVLCERDNVIHCLRDCMRGCSAYRAKAEAVTSSAPVSPYTQAVSAKYNPYGPTPVETRVHGGCGAPCGGAQKHGK